MRLYPRECKAINSKVGLKSLQQYLVVDSVKCHREVKTNNDGTIALPNMSERLLKTCERAVSVEKPGFIYIYIILLGFLDTNLQHLNHLNNKTVFGNYTRTEVVYQKKCFNGLSNKMGFNIPYDPKAK